VTKICGLVDPAASKPEIEERLRSMAAVVNHDPSSPERYLPFEGGGIALIGDPYCGEELWARDERHGSCLALCGSVVGFERGTGALLRSFEERGEELLGELNGVFAFAHHDPSTRSLTVTNDRYGFMPLYYCREGDAFLFASEVKAILRVLRGPRGLDWHSVADFFYVGHMVGQKTLFEGVHAMDSGQVLTYCEGTLMQRQANTNWQNTEKCCGAPGTVLTTMSRPGSA
jgi:Glutamine amidotransferase domain